MNRPSLEIARTGERGMTLVELLVALVILTVGMLSVAQLFPAGSRKAESNSMLTSANFYAQQKLEELGALSTTDAALAVGRHPATGVESLGSSGKWSRFYVVDVLPSPLDKLKRVVVTVNWSHVKARSLSDTLYVGQ